jgi:sortase A
LEKQRREKFSKRSVYKRRRRRGFLILVLLAILALVGLRTLLISDRADEPLEQIATPTVKQAPEAVNEETAAERAAREEAEEAERAATPPEDPTLFLTVPRLGLYGHTVRNDRSEPALDLGAIKLPSTGFPWEKKDTNTYIACHRIGWPGTESYNQCLNLPAMQEGDEVFLEDTEGRVYEYRVSDVFAVGPDDSWTTSPVAGEDVVSLQTCTETPDDWWTIGPSLFGGGPESGRLVVRAERVA